MKNGRETNLSVRHCLCCKCSKQIYASSSSATHGGSNEDLEILIGTSSREILFRRNEHLDLVAYTDVDCAGDWDDRKSTSGYFNLIGGNLVT